MLYANDGTAARQTLTPGPHLTSDAIWLDLVNPTDAERTAAERLTGMRVPSREDLAEIESSSRIYLEEGAMYLSMPYSYLGLDHRSQITPVGFVVSHKVLLTVRFEELPAFEAYTDHFAHNAARGSAPTGPVGSVETFVGLVEAIVDRLADVLEKVASELDRLSKETFQSEEGAVKRTGRRADIELRTILTSIGRCGDTLGNLRDSVLGSARIVGFAQENAKTWCETSMQSRLATLRLDIGSLNDYDQQLNNKVSFLLDAVLGFINIEQNNGVKILTVVSVVGIPPTFVVGLYGMNFKNMPEYDWVWGYQWGWLLILLSVIIPLVWFKIKGWI